MSSSTKSPVTSQPKPVNVFYVWYSELCRRLNSPPAPVVKPAKTKCETVLDFVGDRLKVDEWNPVIRALRQDTSLHVITIRSRLGNCQFLHDIDTEEKARRMKRRYGTLWTAYVLRSLLKSLSYSIRNNQVLTCLELDGLPMFSQYLEPLMQALKKNKTIKSLSFTHCPIKDVGCQMVCGYLRFAANVEEVNFSSCLLTAESGEHLAKLIKYQQINRYCESWHNSLRYEEPNVGLMRGIKRITLNGNPNFGDDGLGYILNELEDDLWIKALDFQKCGITENVADRVLDVLEYNQSLEIVDLRQNVNLSADFIDKVFTILKQKQQFGYQPEFKWCSTALTLPCTSIKNATSSYSVVTSRTNILQKSKSAPMKNHSPSKFGEPTTKDVRRTKTEQFSKKPQQRSPSVSTRCHNQERNKIVRLNSQLNEEIVKRKATERQNEELKKKLEQIQSVTNLQNQLTNKDSVNKIISALESFKLRSKNLQAIEGVNTEKTTRQETNHELKKPKANESKSLNGYTQNCKSTGVKNGIKYQSGDEIKNGYRNGYKNGTCIATVKEQASHIFENLLQRNKKKEARSDDEDEDGDLLNYYMQGEMKNGSHEAKDVQGNTNGANEVSYSQISLISFMEELKSNNTNLTINFKGQPHTSKLSITEKDGGT